MTVREACCLEVLSDEQFSVDGTLIEAWVSMKSFRPSDGRGSGPDGADRDFKGERRRNDTHAGTTDLEAKLLRKAAGNVGLGEGVLENAACWASQIVRKRIEDFWGWSKSVGGLRKSRLRGVRRNGPRFAMNGAAYNLPRISCLCPSTGYESSPCAQTVQARMIAAPSCTPGEPVTSASRLAVHPTKRREEVHDRDTRSFSNLSKLGDGSPITNWQW
ncbi:MAG: hypothetical protein NAOJABEB_01022 [Steroidobacteraceae bacterium]|nr:hypothetical protein [Steroidobacteraceae bacterium]